jgi:hypothetical protein
VADALYIHGRYWGSLAPSLALPLDYGLVPRTATEAGRLQREREDEWNDAIIERGWKMEIDLVSEHAANVLFWRRCGVAVVIAPYWRRDRRALLTTRVFLPIEFWKADLALIDLRRNPRQRIKPLSRGPEGFRTCPETGRIVPCSSQKKSPGSTSPGTSPAAPSADSTEEEAPETSTPSHPGTAPTPPPEGSSASAT